VHNRVLTVPSSSLFGYRPGMNPIIQLPSVAVPSQCLPNGSLMSASKPPGTRALRPYTLHRVGVHGQGPPWQGCKALYSGTTKERELDPSKHSLWKSV